MIPDAPYSTAASGDNAGGHVSAYPGHFIVLDFGADDPFSTQSQITRLALHFLITGVKEIQESWKCVASFGDEVIAIAGKYLASANEPPWILPNRHLGT